MSLGGASISPSKNGGGYQQASHARGSSLVALKQSSAKGEAMAGICSIKLLRGVALRWLATPYYYQGEGGGAPASPQSRANGFSEGRAGFLLGTPALAHLLSSEAKRGAGGEKKEKKRKGHHHGPSAASGGPRSFAGRWLVSPVCPGKRLTK